MNPRALSRLVLFILTIAALLLPATLMAQLCATPGKDGLLAPASGVVNTYHPGVGQARRGAASIAVGAPTAGPAIEEGDLLLVIQMQDARIVASNSDRYGDGVLNDPATGSQSIHSSGLYEFVAARGPEAGGVVPIRGAGPGRGLLNSYDSASPTATRGLRTFQVVRVPQYTDVTLAALDAAPWNGATGGVLAIDVSGDLDLGGGMASAIEAGF